MSGQDGAIIVYDGDCPFCSAYTSMLRLKDAVGPVQLLDAREGGAVVEHLLQDGYDLDEGMVLMLDGQIYHGADCINRLALLSSNAGLFNRFNRIMFRSETLSRVMYPVLRAGRNTTLRLMGRRAIQK